MIVSIPRRRLRRWGCKLLCHITSDRQMTTTRDSSL